MDAQVTFAIRVLFILVAIAPLVLVLVYRWFDVPSRRAEIEQIVGRALKDDKARQALENNPYVSNPQTTFNYYHRLWRYALPLLVLVVLFAASTYVCYSWVMTTLIPPATPSFLARIPTVFIMALAGGLTWSLYQIIIRIRAGELGPADLRDIDMGMLAAVPVGYAFSLIVMQEAASFASFAASAFPLRDVLRLVRQYTMRKMLDSPRASAEVSRPAERHLGTAIEGLSDETLTRLAELRIATVLDMAYSDPIKIMVQTGFALPLIIDWIDQSLWALYAGDLKGELSKHGIRCALDACEFVDLHLVERDKGELKKRSPLRETDVQALKTLADKMGTSEPLLQDLLFRIYTDPQVVVIRWLWYPRGLPKLLDGG